VAAWAAGTVGVLAAAAWKWLGCLRVEHWLEGNAESSLDILVANLSRRLRLRRPVRVMVTPSPVGPAVIGFLRPTIFLPQSIVRGKPYEYLEPILAHELIHIRRGDPWFGLLQLVAQSLWWFHPLVWWAGRSAGREAERCCDEAVLAELGCPAVRYARSLLDVLEQKSQLCPVPACPGVRPIDVTRKRLERIMRLGQGSQRCRSRTPWWCWIAGLAVGAGLLPGAAFVVLAGGEPQTPIVELRIRGNNLVPVEKIIPQIHSRTGRPFEPHMIDEDVRRLYQTRKFVQVSTIVENVPGGKRVTFEILEKPIFQYVKYVGNEAIGKKTLAKETGLKASDPLDTYSVEEGRRKLIAYYQSQGFTKAGIVIAQGTKPNDRGVIYVIDEGPREKVLLVHFVGNTIVSGERLRNQIHTTPGVAGVFKGDLDRKELEEDVKRLANYYHSLGYFDVCVGYHLEPDNNKAAVTVSFVINEGLRYQVRNVRLVGNKAFSDAVLTQDLKLRPGMLYIKGGHLADTKMMQEMYRSKGFASIEIDPQIRFVQEQTGIVDIVYGIKEGSRSSR
jgi:hypothetical protein